MKNRGVMRHTKTQNDNQFLSAIQLHFTILTS